MPGTGRTVCGEAGFKYYKDKVREIRDRLFDEPRGFDFDAEILLLKNGHIENVELINRAVRAGHCERSEAIP